MRLWLAALVLVAGGTQVIVRTPPAPIISSLSVTSGPVGTTVVLTGVHFGTTQGSGTVVFQSATFATPTAWNDISITVTVPVGALTGPVVVVQNGVTSNPVTFTVAGGGVAQTCTANTYYVRTDGSNANTGLANTSAGAWQTITKGVQTAAAGDCIRVQTGQYSETVTPTHNGTSGNTITVVADGTVTACGMTTSGNSYLRVIGFAFDPHAGSCTGPSVVIHTGGTNTGLEFWNDTVGDTTAGPALGATGVTDICNACLVIGGSYHDVTNGNTAVALIGNDNYLAYLALTTICYIGIGGYGSRGRYLGLTFSGFLQCNSLHPDFFYIDAAGISQGFSTSLVEAAFGIGTTTSTDNKYFHAENQSSVAWVDDVWRGNVAYNMGSATSFSMYADNGGNTLTRWRFYHNTSTYGNRASANAGSAVCGNIQNNGGGALTFWVRNTIFYQCWGDSATTNVSPWETTNPTADYNLGFSPNGTVAFTANWLAQTHVQSNVDPKLTNPTGTQDFTLQSSSPARGAGGPLTTAVSCSGTTLNVASTTGTFFIGDNSANLAAYGGKLVPGDVLTIDGTTYTVSSVSGDALTLSASLTCSTGDAVYWGPSSTIDLGAYPYNANGYTLTATKSCSGGTCTITPSDATITRMVICYENSVPYAAVNTSPYTCNNPAGTFEARVYPRYASQTRWAVAQ